MVDNTTTYKRKSDGTIWRHTWTHYFCQYPIELHRMGYGSITITKADLDDNYEEVGQ